jgi:hypothetical protein
MTHPLAKQASPPPRPSRRLSASLFLHRRQCLDHAVQMDRGIFDDEALVLAGPAFGGEQAAAVSLLEVAIGEFISAFGVLAMLFIDAQIPFRIFLEPVPADEVILLLRRRPALAPCVPRVGTKCPSSMSAAACAKAFAFNVTAMMHLSFPSRCGCLTSTGGKAERLRRKAAF